LIIKIIVMNAFIDISSKIVLALKLIITQVSVINDLMVKTDDENLEKLLEKPEDQVKFQKAIDNVIKESNSQNIILNGKNVTIST
jgi:hypothetical protein